MPTIQNPQFLEFKWDDAIDEVKPRKTIPEEGRFTSQREFILDEEFKKIFGGDTNLIQNSIPVRGVDVENWVKTLRGFYINEDLHLRTATTRNPCVVLLQTGDPPSSKILVKFSKSLSFRRVFNVMPTPGPAILFFDEILRFLRKSRGDPVDHRVGEGDHSFFVE